MSEQAPLITMKESRLDAMRKDANAAGRMPPIRIWSLILQEAVTEIDAQRARQTPAPTCATCVVNGNCLIQRHAAEVCRDDVPDAKAFGCTLHEPAPQAARE